MKQRGENMIYKLKAKRVEKGIKQHDLAEQLGISPQYLCKIEKGQADPKRDLMIRIATALGEDVQQLFFIE